MSFFLSLLNNKKYKVINHLVLSSNGFTTQVDHIVISDYGVFVIETKNYKGKIYGGEYSNQWTQVLYRQRHALYNPIRQNEGHIRALQYHLRAYPHIRYVSLVVFSSKASLRVKAKTPVIYMGQLNRTIKKYRDVNLTEQTKEDIHQTLLKLNAAKTFNQKEHVKSIQKRVQKRQESIRKGKCPRCDSKLVKRTGKFGPFWGCSSYPKCRFTAEA